MTQPKICSTCGTQFPANSVPDVCPICEDDRQYVPQGGQRWTTEAELQQKHSVRILKISDRVYELEMIPQFAIGQRAFLVISDGGNILWDCFPLLNESTVEFIRSKGGLQAMAFSHPHYYSNMNDWAATFDCPIYIHASDAEWIMDRGRHVNLWEGQEEALWDGMKLMNIGGHFPGSSILHVPFLSPEGTVFPGDTVYVSPSMKHMAVMYSYPNRIPLPLHEIKRIRQHFEAISFDTLYGFYSYQNVEGNAKDVLMASLGRYLQ